MSAAYRAIKAEVQNYIETHSGELDPESGHRQVVRSGYMAEREV